jgi:ABC-2 type transport system permease protein
MISLIFKKELKELFRTSKVVWMLSGMVVLMLLALYNGNSYHKSHSSLIKESQEMTYRQFISQGDKNPHLGAHFGFYAYKPTSDMAMIENGIEDYTGNSFYLEPHKRGVVKFREISDATGLRSFGFLNISYLAEFVLPLFIFLICHNIFSKEWENGTIKMLLSSKASSRQIFMGKLFSCLSLVMGIVLFIAVSSLLLFWNESDSPGFMIRVLPAFGCYLLGLLLFSTMMTTIGVSISLLTKSANLSLIVLSGFWLIGVFLLPRLAAELSKNTHPSITSLEFENTTFNEKQYGVGKEGHKDIRREALLQKTMRQYHVNRIEDLPVFFIPITIEFFEESDGIVMDKAYQAVDDNQAKQDRLVLNSAWLTPFLAFRDFSMRMTATDMTTHNDFTARAEAHRRKIGVIVDNYYQKNTVAGNSFWKTVPQFAYTAPGISWRLNNAANSIFILMGWTLLSICLMVYAYRKMTV